MTLTSNGANIPPPEKLTALGAADDFDEEGIVCGTCGEKVELVPSAGGYDWKHTAERYYISSDHKADPVSKDKTGPPPEWVDGPLDLHEWHPDNLSRPDRYRIVREAVEHADPYHYRRRGKGFTEGGT